METTHHQHNCDAQMTTLLGEVRNGVRFLVLQYTLHQTRVAAMDTHGEMETERTARTVSGRNHLHAQQIIYALGGKNLQSRR